MKFVLVFLLTVCAFTAQAADNDFIPEERSVVFKGLQDIIEGIIKFAERAINAILNAAKRIVEKAQEQINAILEGVIQTIDKLLEKINDILEKLAGQNEKSRQCVEKYRPEVEAANKKAKDNLKVCNENAQKELESLHEEAAKHVQVIRGYIQDSRNIIKDCYENQSNIVSSAGCVIEKANELRKNLREAVNEAYQGISAARKQAARITKEKRQCFQDVQKTLKEELAEILKQVQICIAE